MKFWRALSLILLTGHLLLGTVSSAHAVSVEPFPPFSVEGNPDQDYYFGEIFTLFRYFRPRALEIYENLDRSRTYVDLQVCPGADADRRDYYCNNQGDGCDGGEVDLCHNDPTNQSFSHTVTSKGGSCKLNRKRTEDPDELIEGKCEYTKRPSVITKVKGTDFSVKDELTYPKYQGESNAYNYIGTENEITWGSMYLSTDPCEIAIRKVQVVRRAKQTKNTLRETGEWPLGWVDWGYKDSNMTKTLLEINDELPDSIASQLNSLVESIDDFYVTAGSLISDTSDERRQICNAVSEARAQPTPPEWLKDLDSVPMYPPSFRQGYVRPSICIWDKCCPTTRCPLSIEELLGSKRGLYYDLSISQAYGAALDDLFMAYPFDQAMKIFTQIVTNNPLVRYLGSAAPEAIPSRVRAELDIQLKDTCLKYIPWGNWLSFGTHMDYLDSDNFLGPNKTCPDYQLMPELTKETAGATSASLLDAIINLIWGRKVDDVEPDKYHLLTIPDAMGQSIQEIQQAAYNIRDTASDLEGIKEYNLSLSNIVDDSAQFLYAGKILGPADAKRRFGHMTCDDPNFSSQIETSVEAYAMGTRVGCENKETLAGQCDPSKFAGIIADSKWKAPLPAAKQIILNSAMFVGGKLNPELEKVYAQVSKETGVPCEVLAGHHFEEGTQFFTNGGDPTKHSVANGRALKEIGQTLLKSAQLAAQEVSNRPYYAKNTAGLIAAMSNFNGGGNANCQQGFPAPIPYGGCPREFVGADDPYVVNMLDSKRTNMFLLYCGDFLPCIPPKPYGNDRPGAFSAALVVHEYIAQQSPSSSPTTSSGNSSNDSQPSGGQRRIISPETCSGGAVSTALGCLPYTPQAFASTLLSFLVGIAGAIALTTMLIATFRIMTAGDNAEQLQKGKELFMSATTGLLFLIFSVSLLRIIAGDIIKLPGF